MKFNIFLHLIVFMIMFCAGSALAHPVAQYVPNEADPAYGTDGFGADPAWSYGDLTFTRPYPDAASLTPGERYILFGATSANGLPGIRRNLSPWYVDLWQLVSAIHARDGYIPAQLDEALVRSVARDPDGVSANWVELHKSPLTGNFPRLDASSFSPGDVYIRALTESEMQHFASRVNTYNREWYMDQVRDPRSGEWVPGHLVGVVYYIRVYGESGVLFENLMYSMVPDVALEISQ